jgi:hypothetical protein
MRDGLVCWTLHQADAAAVDFVHTAGVLRNIACRAPFQDDHMQSRSRSYLFRHHQTAPPAANDDYVGGFKALQPDTILSIV